nr:MAG TPA_asm: hypothetical protein [Bacteriophage sp.]
MLVKVVAILLRVFNLIFYTYILNFYVNYRYCYGL